MQSYTCETTTGGARTGFNYISMNSTTTVAVIVDQRTHNALETKSISTVMVRTFAVATPPPPTDLALAISSKGLNSAISTGLSTSTPADASAPASGSHIDKPTTAVICMAVLLAISMLCGGWYFWRHRKLAKSLRSLHLARSRQNTYGPGESSLSNPSMEHIQPDKVRRPPPSDAQTRDGRPEIIV